MKNTFNIDITNDQQKLIAKNFNKITQYSGYWKNCLKNKLPTDYNLSDDELMSELYYTLLYLAKNYKNGELLFVSYCNNYIVLITYKRLIATYKKIRREVPLEDQNEHNDEDDNGNVISKVTPCYQIEQHNHIENIENQEILNVMHKVAKKLGKKYEETLQLYKQEYTWKDIAEKLNISIIVARKRIAKIVEETKKYL